MSVDESRGLFFLDTNILIYAQTVGEPRKQQRAAALVAEALRSRRGLISTQVVQEFLNVATRHAAPVFTAAEAADYLNEVLWPLCGHVPDRDFYERALQIRSETGYAFYDALIVTAAVESGCRVLYSEDLQHDRVVRGVRLVDPFRD